MSLEHQTQIKPFVNFPKEDKDYDKYITANLGEKPTIYEENKYYQSEDHSIYIINIIQGIFFCVGYNIKCKKGHLCVFSREELIDGDYMEIIDIWVGDIKIEHFR